MLLAAAAAVGSVSAMRSAEAQTVTVTWAGNTNTSWGTAANWNAAPVSGNALYFGSAGSQGSSLTDNLTTGSGYSIAGITFGSTAAAYTINPAGTSNNFTLAGGITDSSTTNTETLNDNFALSGSNTLTSKNTLVLGGTISGTGSITVAGGGSVVLSGSNSYSGVTTFSGANSGTLVLLNAAAAGTGGLSAPAAVGNAIDLKFGGGNISNVLGGGSGFGETLISDVASAGPGVNYNFVNGGTLGTGTLNVIDGSNVSGGIGTITLGTVVLSSGVGTLTTINPTTANAVIGTAQNYSASSFGHTLDLDGTSSGNSVTGSIVNGSASYGFNVLKSNTSTWTLTGSSTYTGSTTVNAGTLFLNGGTLIGGALNAVNGGTFIVTNGAINAGGGNVGSFEIGTTLNTNASLILNSGTINAVSASNPSVLVGVGTNGATGALIINGGSFNTGGSQFWVGDATATTQAPFGALIVNGGSFNTTTHIQIGIGSAGLENGELVQSGGTITEGTALAVGNSTYNASNTTPDIATISGGTFNITGSNIAVGASTNAVLTLSGGALVNSGSISIGGSNATTDVVNLDGGTLNTGSILAGGSTSTNLLNFNGGTLAANSSANATFLAGLTHAYVYAGGGTINNSGKSITIAQPLLTTTTGNGVSLSGVSIASSSGYIAPPIVTVSGTGTGATAIATISGGAVTGFTITNPGIGYTGTPTFTLTGGGGTTTTAGAASAVANTDGGLTFMGTGTTTLSGVNTYTGPTSITGGTLLISSTGAINGTSSITINGSGAVLSLNNATTAETPAITVTKGQLIGVGTISAGAVSLGNGTGASVTNTAGSTFTLNSLTFNGTGTANLSIAGGSNVTSTGFNVTNALTTPANGAGSITLNVNSVSSLVAGDTYDLIQYGSFTGGTTDFSLGAVSGFGPRSLTLGTSGNYLTLTISASPDNPKWTGLDGNNWQVGSTGANGNWQLITAGVSTNYMTGDVVLFDDTGLGAVNPGSVSIFAGNVMPSSTTFNNDGSLSYTVSSPGGYGIAGAGSLGVTGGGAVTLLTTNTYTGATSITSGTLQLGNGTIGNDGVLTGTSGITDNGALVYDRAGSYTDSIAVSGTGSVSYIGSGTETLSVSNSYTGSTQIGGGTVVLGTASALPSSGTLIVSGGTLNLNGKSPSIYQLSDGGSSAGTLTNSSGTTSTLTTTGFTPTTFTYSGAITGNVAMNMQYGTLVLDGANNTYSGSTTLGLTTAAACIVAESTNALGTGTIYFTGGTAGDQDLLKLSGGITLPNYLSVGGRVTNPFPFVENLSGNNTLSGVFFPNTGGNLYILRSDAGTLNLTNSTAISVGAAKNLILLGAGNGEILAPISTVGSISMNGSGSWILGAPSSAFAGTISVGGGTIQLGTGTAGQDSNLTAASGIAVASKANLAYSPAGTATGTYIISGAGNVYMTGSGTTILSTAETYSGSTNVSNGLLDITGSVASSTAINATGGTLQLDTANAVSSSAPVTNNAVFNINASQALASIAGTGTTNLSSAATVGVSGGVSQSVINSAGTLNISSGTSIVGLGNGVGTGTGTTGFTSGGITGTGTLSVSSGAQLYASHISHSLLNIDATSTVTISDSAAPGNTAAVSVLTDINNSGTLDLKNNDLIVTDPTQYSNIKTLINNAADGGAWDQAGITSSSAHNNSSVYGLGYAPASALTDPTAFEGVALSGTGVETIVKYTLLGDTQLRGQVGIGDYDTVLSNFGTAQDWSGGNFHYGGNVGIGDYDNVLSNFGATLSGNVVGRALTRGLAPALSTPAQMTPALGLSSALSKNDIKLEVNTVSGDVYALTTTSVNFTGYTVADPSAHLLAGSTSPDPAKLLSVANGGSTNVYETSGQYVDWFKISETASQLAEGQNNNGFANHSSRDDTLVIPSGGTIDFGDIYNTAAGVQDITFNFAEAGTTPTNGPAYYGAEVDYISGVSTPEPGSMSLLAVGAVGMLARRRRRAQ